VPVLELGELLELEEDAVVHAIGMLSQDGLASAGDLDHRPAGPADKASLIQVGNSPVQAIDEQPRPARQGRFQVLIGQPDLLGDYAPQLRNRLFRAVRERAQDRCHQRLVVRDSHHSFLAVPTASLACFPHRKLRRPHVPPDLTYRARLRDLPGNCPHVAGL
jgi:hypothetical protein